MKNNLKLMKKEASASVKQRELQQIVQEIIEKNEKKWGKIQECCGQHQKYCRCPIQ